MNELLSNAVKYCRYRLSKTSARYDDDVANELNKRTKKTTVQIKDRTFSGRDPVSIIAFLQNFKTACDACNIHEGTDMRFSSSTCSVLSKQ